MYKTESLIETLLNLGSFTWADTLSQTQTEMRVLLHHSLARLRLVSVADNIYSCGWEFNAVDWQQNKSCLIVYIAVCNTSHNT